MRSTASSPLFDGGDQPQAITELAERNGGGKGRSCSAPRHGERHDGLADREDPTAHARAGPEQDTGRPAGQTSSGNCRRTTQSNTVSYYDYYQPGRPTSRRPIRSSRRTGQRGGRTATALRHQHALTRRDVIVVATVSASTVWGPPRSTSPMVTLRKGMEMNRDELLRKFVSALRPQRHGLPPWHLVSAGTRWRSSRCTRNRLRNRVLRRRDRTDPHPAPADRRRSARKRRCTSSASHYVADPNA